mgnify:FL=1|jgi:hypothetical protein|tara:strand:- start:2234 stop:2452 length:219 start_codon:yes stop_codon:yes gene_type:complete
MEKNGKTYDGKYPHGFLPKISYWMGKWEEAAEVRDEESMKTAEKKLMYFFGRQLDLNNKDQDGDAQFNRHRR